MTTIAWWQLAALLFAAFTMGFVVGMLYLLWGER